MYRKRKERLGLRSTFKIRNKILVFPTDIRNKSPFRTNRVFHFPFPTQIWPSPFISSPQLCSILYKIRHLHASSSFSSFAFYDFFLSGTMMRLFRVEMTPNEKPKETKRGKKRRSAMKFGRDLVPERRRSAIKKTRTSSQLLYLQPRFLFHCCR